MNYNWSRNFNPTQFHIKISLLLSWPKRYYNWTRKSNSTIFHIHIYFVVLSKKEFNWRNVFPTHEIYKSTHYVNNFDFNYRLWAMTNSSYDEGGIRNVISFIVFQIFVSFFSDWHVCRKKIISNFTSVHIMNGLVFSETKLLDL